MSPSASERQADASATKPAYPVAGPPPNRRAPAPKASPPRTEFDDEEVPRLLPFWTLETLKSWAGSMTLHGLLLLVLGLWYLAPPARTDHAFEGRLAGSENGIGDGFNFTGGLNMPLETPEPIEDVVGLSPAQNLIEMPPVSIEPPVAKTVSARASGGGGVENNNPGAGEGDGFGLARFGNGGELIQGVSVKVGDPQFTLIWDTDADLDLHVIEPGGKEIYWESPKGDKGGELDVDNTKGFGPENVYWLEDPDAPEGKKVKGQGPPGKYQWFIVYWGGFGGIPKPTHWKVRIKHAGKVTVIDGKFRALNERSRTYTLQVGSE